MKKNRVLTESEAYFPRCVALPAREKLLLEEEMMLYMGQSGGTSGGSSGSRSRIPAPIIAGDANKIINSQTPKEVEDLSKMAVFGVIPVGNTDSTATSVRRELENVREALTDTSSTPPTNSDSTTEDTSESLWDTVKDWLGF